MAPFVLHEPFLTFLVGSRETPLWRRGPSKELLCNACALFLKNRGKIRPVSAFSFRLREHPRAKTAGYTGERLRRGRPLLLSRAPLLFITSKVPKRVKLVTSVDWVTPCSGDKMITVICCASLAGRQRYVYGNRKYSSGRR